MGEVKLTEKEAAMVLGHFLEQGFSANLLGTSVHKAREWIHQERVSDPEVRAMLPRTVRSVGIDPLMVIFFRSDSSTPGSSDEHARWRDAAREAQRLLTYEGVEQMTALEWAAFLQSLEATRENPWDQSGFWQRKFGDVLPSEVRSALRELIAKGEAGMTATDFTYIKSQLADVGMSMLSEILALRFPYRYWIVSSRTLEYLRQKGIDLSAELPRGKKTDIGERYMAAGRHLVKVNENLTMESDHSVDFLETERFIRGAVDRMQSDDPWEGRVREIIRESVRQERLDVRRAGEENARELLKEYLGRMAVETIDTFFRFLNADFSGNSALENRFAITTIGRNQKLMQSELAVFNRWTETIWRADDDEIPNVLDAFWRANDLPGAGTTFPTMILYLRDPDRYAIWLPVASSALELVGELSPGRFRTADGYMRFNEAAKRFRDRYAIPPEALDLVLSTIGKRSDAVEPAPPSTQPVEEERYTLDNLVADTFLEKDFWSVMTALLDDKHQIILYGPPGTGKTWVARQFARHFIELVQSEEEMPERGTVEVVQLHPSYAYEEFVEGIRPTTIDRPGGGRDISYDVREGIFKRLCREAAANPAKRYVLILDEINRADVARVFGELLYLLEYRGESAALPYSGENFHVPKNLYIIGTMNSADRSIALIDLALRRRFHFIKLEPNVEALRKFHAANNPDMAWTADLLYRLNKQLSRDGRDWQYHIGHSHFMSGALDEQRLRYIWEYTIMPTLEEYFHKDQARLHDYALDALRKRSELPEES